MHLVGFTDFVHENVFILNMNTLYLICVISQPTYMHLRDEF